MTTMTIKPYVHLVPVLTGKISYKNVYNFYKNHFIGKMLKDTKIIRIPCTADKYQKL
jgi:carboxymethylenebutenolidase